MKVKNFCGITSIFLGLVVLAGWLLDIPVLTSIRSDWVTMKTITAFGFILSGLIVLSSYTKHTKVSDFILPSATSLLLATVNSLFKLHITGGDSLGVHKFLVEESGSPVMTAHPGEPAILTTVCFMLVGFIGLAAFFNGKIQRISTLIFAGGIFVISFGALLGYWINYPPLYGRFHGLTAMAIHTAMLFNIISIGFFSVAKRLVVKSRRKNRIKNFQLA